MSRKRLADEILVSERRSRIKLASPSPERTSASDTESIHSCQGYKTELANDTSDTSDTSSPVPQSSNAEYEVTDPDDLKLKFYCSDDSLEEYDIVDGAFNAASTDSLDVAFFGDTSEENSTSPSSNSDIDPGLPRNDFLDFEKCLLCQTDKKKISYPYCSTCFTWRKNLFPSRPKKRKKNQRANEGLIRSNCVLDSQNNDNGSSCNTNKIIDGSLSDGQLEDSGVGSSEPQLSEDVVDGPLKPSTSSSTSNSASDLSNINSCETCRVCFLKPENGLFVHQNSAHRYGCYSCAKEIWYNNGGCPICRRKVYKVTKLYI